VLGQLDRGLHGDVAIQISRVAAAHTLDAFASQAELLAVGTQRHGFLERLVVGSVATRVLRAARRGVLAVPAA
jgi:nucleotide-binding universal stress UspA family protein